MTAKSKAALGRVLTVAGSDSGGGAGIQADLKTITMLGAYGASAITALTVQNTQGVSDVMPVHAEFVSAQIEVVLGDIGADAIKTGMLPNADIITATAKAIDEHAPEAALIVDPVMTAKGGAVLTPKDAINALRNTLIPDATLVTPNIPEAEEMLGRRITSLGQMKEAAGDLLKFDCDAVLLKGGHLDGDELFDVLATGNTMEVFTSPRLNTPHTHGTGCTLASAIAAGLAQAMPMREAVMRGRDYVHEAIRLAPGLGEGHGPLNHGLVETPETQPE